MKNRFLKCRDGILADIENDFMLQLIVVMRNKFSQPDDFAPLDFRIAMKEPRVFNLFQRFAYRLQPHGNRIEGFSAFFREKIIRLAD
jgi:hypothetical protein